MLTVNNREGYKKMAFWVRIKDYERKAFSGIYRVKQIPSVNVHELIIVLPLLFLPESRPP
jgi:hypothetical protein